MTTRKGLHESRPEVEREAQLPQTADEMKAWFRERLAALHSPVGAAFERLSICYAVGLSAANSRQDFTWEADRWGCYDYQREMWSRADRRRREMFAELEPQATLILRAMDDALAGLTVILTGRADAMHVGPQIAKGQHLAEILHAVGNYLRHSQEWRNIWLSCRSFTPRQLASIRPLTHTVVDGAPTMSDDDAYDAFLRMPMPLLSILDAASAYDDSVGFGRYDVLEENVADAADATIDACWPQYDSTRRMHLAGRRQHLESAAKIRAQLSTIAFVEFVGVADKVMRENLFEDVRVRSKGLDSDDARWSNGLVYVRIMKGDEFTAHIYYGMLDETWGELLGSGDHYETRTIDPESARETGEFVLADWLNSDEINDVGFPVYVGRG